MSATIDPSVRESRDQAITLLQQLVLSQASRLARRGDTNAAEQLLQELLRTGSKGVGALDLLARIRAQRGALVDAEMLWREVLEQDPNHLGARAALERIRAMNRGSLRLAPFAVAIVALAALTALALVQQGIYQREKTSAGQQQAMLRSIAESKHAMESQLGQMASTLQSLTAAQSNSAAGQRSLDARMEILNGASNRWLSDFQHAQTASSNQIAELRLRIADLSASLSQPRPNTIVTQVLVAQPAAAAQPAVPPLARSTPRLRQQISGIRTQVSGSKLILTFEDGLFDHDTHFRIGAKELLENVARELARENSKVEINAIGYSDDDDRIVFPWSKFKDEHSLALGRAAAAIETIHQLGAFDPAKLHAAGSTASLPFRGDTPRMRLKNRTVVLHVSLAD